MAWPQPRWSMHLNGERAEVSSVPFRWVRFPDSIPVRPSPFDRASVLETRRNWNKERYPLPYYASSNLVKPGCIDSNNVVFQVSSNTNTPAEEWSRLPLVEEHERLLRFTTGITYGLGYTNRGTGSLTSRYKLIRRSWPPISMGNILRHTFFSITVKSTGRPLTIPGFFVIVLDKFALKHIQLVIFKSY